MTKKPVSNAQDSELHSEFSEMNKRHPVPWKVAYNDKRDGISWNDRAMPRIIDANSGTVVQMPQFVIHPGMFDKAASSLAKGIVDCVNSAQIMSKENLNAFIDMDGVISFGSICSRVVKCTHF